MTFPAVVSKNSAPRRERSNISFAFHRRASGHDRRRHDASGSLAQAQRLSCRPGADVLSRSHGDGDRDVPQRQESPEEGDPRQRERRHRPRGATPTPAQGVPALPRPEKLAFVARSPAGHGTRRSHRQRQAAPGAPLPAGHRGDYQSARRKNSTAAGSPRLPGHARRILTQHTGPPPRAGVQATAARASRKRESHRGRA